MKLGVNIDHVATVRQARGTTYPRPLDAALLAASSGADGITIHLREDRRHIQDADLFDIRRALSSIPLNLEMGNNPEILEIALRARPDEVCMVPERRREVTTEGGLDAAGLFDSLRPSVDRLAAAGIRVSLFIEPDPAQIDAAIALRVPMVELHTGRYANLPPDAVSGELDRLAAAARRGHAAGLQINAGHGLNLENLPAFLAAVPHLDTLNIGHSIIARALFVGLPAAIAEMKALLPA